MKNYSRLLQKLLFCVYLPTTSLSVVNTRLHDVAFRVTLTSAGSVTISSPSLISYKNVLSHAFFFQCHDHTFAKIDWSPQTAQTASRGDVSVKPQRKCFTEKAFNHLPFFFFSWQSPQQTSHQHEWRNSSGEKWHAVLSGERCPSCATIQQMVLLSLTTASCSSPLTSFCVVMKTSPCYLHIAQIILCFSFSFTFILIFHAIHDYGLCGGRVMNKLSIRGKAKSYSEVTCLLLPF